GPQHASASPPAAAGVCAGESRPAPQVVTSRARKRVNRIRDRHDVGALHKPDAATEALIEDASCIPVQADGQRLFLDVSTPTEIAFMKTVAVDHEPAQ